MMREGCGTYGNVDSADGTWQGEKKECKIIMWQSRSVQSGGARGEAGREALALPQKAQRYDCGGDSIIKNQK